MPANTLLPDHCLPAAPPRPFTPGQQALLSRLPPFSQSSPLPIIAFYRSLQPTPQGSRRPEPLAFARLEGKWHCYRGDITAEVSSLARALRQCWREYQEDAFRLLNENDAAPLLNEPPDQTDWLLRASLAVNPGDIRLRQCLRPRAAFVWAAGPEPPLEFDPGPLARELLEMVQDGRDAALRVFQDLGDHKPSFELLQGSPQTLSALARLNKAQPAAARWYAHRCLTMRLGPRTLKDAQPETLLSLSGKLFLKELSLPGSDPKELEKDWEYFMELDPRLVTRSRRPDDYRRLRLLSGGAADLHPSLAAIILDGRTPPRPGKGPLPWTRSGNTLPETVRRQLNPPPPGLTRWIHWLDRLARQIGQETPENAQSQLRRLLAPLQLFLTPLRKTHPEAPLWRALQVRAWQALEGKSAQDPARADAALRALYQPAGSSDTAKPQSRKQTQAAALHSARDWYTELQREIQAILEDSTQPPALTRLLARLPQPRWETAADGSLAVTQAAPGVKTRPTRPEQITFQLSPQGELAITAQRRIWRAADGDSDYFTETVAPELLPKSSWPRLPARRIPGPVSSLLEAHIGAALHSLILNHRPLTRRWGADLLRCALNDQPPQALLQAAADRHAADFQELLSQVLNPEALLQTEQTNPPDRRRQLAVYNQLATAQNAYQPLFRTNPAPAAWLALRASLNDYEHYDQIDPATGNHELQRWSDLRLNHPGQAISLIRSEFAQAKAKHWRAFATRSADFPGTVFDWIDSYADPRQLQMQQIFYFSDVMFETGLTLAELQARPPARQALTLLNNNHGTRLARLLARQLKADAAVARDKEALSESDLDRCQEAYNVLDWLRSPDRNNRRARNLGPETTARSWRGLVKKAAAWHREHARIKADQQIHKALRRQQGRLKHWNSLVSYATSLPAGWTAQAVADEAALYLESQTMSHCVGSDSYLEECWAGRSRIFHLASPDHKEQLTLELAGDPARLDTFTQRQLSGPGNSRPSNAGQEAAGSLAIQYRAAALRQPNSRHRSWLAEPAPDSAATPTSAAAD